jgi:hypothetical protein
MALLDAGQVGALRRACDYLFPACCADKWTAYNVGQEAMKKLGNPLPPVKDIAQPSEAEIDALVAKWDANCPPFFVGLMEAQLTTEPNPTAKFLYDKSRMQYIHRATGRVLTRNEINEAWIAYTDKVSKK